MFKLPAQSFSLWTGLPISRFEVALKVLVPVMKLAHWFLNGINWSAGTTTSAWDSNQLSR